MAKSRTTRAMSLSLDWDNMVKEGESEKGSKAHLAGTVAFDKDTLEFCTGSTYTGKWNGLGMAVYGNYTYPHGCEYEGGFEDGMFHGEGVLLFPMGQKLEGYWEKGKMVAYKFSNSDGLEYNDNWKYCVMPDRRFSVSIREGLQPAGREFLTNQQPERYVPPGHYDTGDGFYNPVTRSLIAARDPEDYAHLDEPEQSEGSGTIDKAVEDNSYWPQSVTMVDDARHDWIVNNCRKGWDEPTGYRPDLFEDWITGRKSELENLDLKYTEENSSLESVSDSNDKNASAASNEVSEEKLSIDYAGTGRKLSLSTSRTGTGSREFKIK